MKPNKHYPIDPAAMLPRPKPEDMPPALPGEPLCGQSPEGKPYLRCQRKAGHDGPHSALAESAAAAEDADVARGQRQGEDQAREYRRKKFKVKCEPSRLREDGEGPAELHLSLTSNGYQWTTLGVYADEVPAVVTALQQAALLQRWPTIAARMNSEAPTPYADAFCEFQKATDRFAASIRALADASGALDHHRLELHNAHIDLLAIYNRQLGQLQDVGLLPLTSPAA